WIIRYTEGWLINVGLTLQMQATAADITDREERLPKQLALDGEVPIPRFRILERFALSGDNQRNSICTYATRIVGRTVGDACIRLEGRIAPQEDGVTHAKTSKEAPAPGTDDRFVVELIGDSESGLDLSPLNIRVMIRDAT